MATFQAIGLNLAIGSAVFAGSMAAFSAAVYWEWNSELAPRTWARPRQVLKNVLRRSGRCYGISWIPWTLGLSYQQMLEGIPGTGTRNNGWSGSLLRCNLDGIIAIKFHALCFKVAIVATVLCMAIVLPINVTAECHPSISGAAICTNITRLTNFETTTLAHIPPMDFVDPTSTEDVNVNADATIDNPRFSSAMVATSLQHYFATSPGITSRLFVIVIVAWVIFVYTCALIWNEWIDNLALRRVFYLEHDHFAERKQELNYLATLSDDELEYQKKRPPYIPHPEIRDTIPNVALYSVLYKLPDYFYSTAATPTASMLDRQLSATVDFFDRCVPNQPGFSSSVAAVTILPDTVQVARAWKKWYACASKLRRLKYIRSRIRQLEESERPETTGRQLHTEHMNSSIASSTTSQKPQHEYQYGNTDSVLDIEEAIQNDHSGPISPISTSPRRSQMNVLSTVEEFEDASSEPTSHGELSPPLRNSQCSFDIQSTETLTVITESTKDLVVLSEPTKDLVVVRDFCSCLDDVQESEMEKGHIGTTNEPNRLDSLSPVCRESNFLYAGTIESPTSASWVPSITTTDSGDKSPLNMIDIPDHLESSHPLASVDLRRSPDTVGHAEEAQLDLFLSDEGMEQLSVYCREFAQSSAGCCPYGCDHSMLKEADLEVLKELEVEAQEDLEEANRALIEVRASVNKTDVNIEGEETGSSFIARRRARDTSLLSSDAKTSTCSYSVSDKQSREINSGPANSQEMVSSGRRQQSSTASSESRWQMAADIANENRQHHNRARGRHSNLSGIPSGRWYFERQSTDISLPSHVERSMKKGNIVSSVVDYHTYAVVTFTSRQAAIAARQCMADGSGLGRWEELEEIPIPPLADSAPCDICLCRGCCRPVTLTINDSQKRCRKNITWLCLVLFCCLYTIPLSLTSNLLSPDRLSTWFPTVDEVGVLSGILTGLIYTGFFSVCPFIFKSLANFGSGATSQRQAEFIAIKYYWIFILVTAFTGSSLATMITSGLYSGLNLGASAQEVLRQVAKAIPTQVSATWLNWIIVRFTFTIPVLYFFQSNTFLFKLIGWECCARCTRGGGPGGPLPFRIYVDSGVVFLCVVALAPACPLVAPAGMLYYLVFAPVLRWLLIFVHRPQYDGGGKRWPILHEILISSMIVAQILLTTMMVLKKAYGPAFLASLSIFPTFVFGQIAKERFLRCYNDAGLVQTSQLDGWDECKPMSYAEREEFRRWLVDCHKASYIPICLAGTDSNLTAEPAVALPVEIETMVEERNMALKIEPRRPRAASQESMFAHRPRTGTLESAFASSLSSTQGHQKGALFRRVHHSSSTTLQSRTSQVFFPA